MYSEEYYIEKCKRLIERDLGWDKSEKWRHSDYEKLAGLIFAKTGVRISHITLKRLWGKIEFKGVPHINTLDALARYSGFANWMDYKAKLPKDDEYIEKTNLEIRKNRNVRIAVLSITGIVFLILLHIVLRSFRNDSPIEKILENDNINFVCSNSVGDVPHTVNFLYDVSGISSDNIFIQPDKEIKIQLDKTKNQLNYLYHFPGFYKVDLLVDERIIESVNVHVTTKGWIVGFYKAGNDLNPVLMNNQIIRNGILQLQIDNPILNTLDGKFDYWVNYLNSRDFGLKADQFFFEARIKNDGYYEYHCGDFQISLIGNNGLYEFKFVNPGCAGNVKLYVHSKLIDGKNNDLSMFETDLKKWHTVNFIAKSDTGIIYLDNRPVYYLDLFRPMDSLKCIRFKTRTNGAVDYVKLLNRNNDVVFYDDFE